MLPDEERQQGHAEHASCRHPVPEQGLAAEHRQQLRDDAEAGQGHDVDLGMAEEPEQVFPQEAAAAMLVHEEGGLRGAVQDAEQAGGY